LHHSRPIIQAQEYDGRATGWSSAHGPRTFKNKMLIPDLSVRIEETNDSAIDGINGGQIRTFVAVAIEAGKSEVINLGSPAVLERDDVVDVVGKRKIILMEQAVLTASLSPFNDETAKRIRNV
jgi:hypothetical protein